MSLREHLTRSDKQTTVSFLVSSVVLKCSHTPHNSTSVIYSSLIPPCDLYTNHTETQEILDNSKVEIINLFV